MPAERETARRHGAILLLVSLLATACWLVLLMVSAFNGLVVGLGLLLLLALNPKGPNGWRLR